MSNLLNKIKAIVTNPRKIIIISTNVGIKLLYYKIIAMKNKIRNKIIFENEKFKKRLLKSCLDKPLNKMSEIAIKLFKNKLQSYLDVTELKINGEIDFLTFLYKKEEEAYYTKMRTTTKSRVENEKGFFTNYGLNIKNAEIFGASNAIVINDKIIYTMKERDKLKKIDFTDPAISAYEEDRFLINKYKEKKKIARGIYVGGNASYNYYHFLIEIISKFKYLDEIKLDKSIPLIVDEINIKIPQFKRLIEIFNTNNRELIVLNKEQSFNVEELFYMTSPNHIPINLKKGAELIEEDSLYNYESLKFIRSKILANLTEIKQESPIKSSKIFISRKNASSLRSFNEKEVIKFLEKHNFEVVYPEEHTIEEQAAIFNNAKFIIGGGGAAFTNILFCNRDCRVILLTNYNIKTSIFSSLANISKIDFVYYCAKEIEDQSKIFIHDSYVVDIRRLEKLILEMEKR